MKSEPPEPVRAAIERTVREEWSQALAVLVHRIRDFQLAEDALQDAIVAAWQHWPSKGIPQQPRAWLLKTARRKAIDQIRRRENFESKRLGIALHAELESGRGHEETDTEIPDERLRMIFTCCHPALDKQSCVALTLRAVGGLETREIARAFLVEEPTMAQRLTRAKRKIKDAGIPYRIPPPELWPERLEAVLSVVYFIFNEGYLASSGKRLMRADLCAEAIHLGRVLAQLAPKETEAAGLLALMLLHDSRRDARLDGNGTLVPLEQQNRALWDRAKIAEGEKILRETLSKGSIGPYQIQAAVSALHANASDWDATDWPQIAHLYRILYQAQPSAVVRLNEAIALSMAQGPKAGLAILAELEEDGLLQNYQPFFAAKADLLRRQGQAAEATEAYRVAIEKSAHPAERAFLAARLQALSSSSSSASSSSSPPSKKRRRLRSRRR